jgi:hypothetical protein
VGPLLAKPTRPKTHTLGYRRRILTILSLTQHRTAIDKVAGHWMAENEGEME